MRTHTQLMHDKAFATTQHMKRCDMPYTCTAWKTRLLMAEGGSPTGGVERNFCSRVVQSQMNRESNAFKALKEVGI